ncbi:hypothetical protein [Wolbachia endosymbiont (group B) of Apotomis betuletana]|uniref:hypothetical protein n=1 Tax=Wolbachia endosymbiont (group B) of Apotomis betuletana TaxID=2953982 RepID=UPI003873439F
MRYIGVDLHTNNPSYGLESRINKERNRVNSSILAIIKRLPMKKDITELYCFIEDFCRIADEKLSEKLLSSGKKNNKNT